MFCRNCGTKLEDDALFCTSCGTPTNEQLENSPAQQPVTPEQNQYTASQPASTSVADKGIKKKLIIAGIVVAVIILLIIIILVASNGLSKEDETIYNTDDNGYSYSDNDDDSFYQETGNNTITSSSYSSYISSSDLLNEGDDVDKGDGYISASFNNPKSYAGCYIIIDGVKVELPSTPQQVELLTGYTIELPENQLPAMTTSWISAEKGGKEITLDVTNKTDAPLAYKDCSVEYITVSSEYGDCPVAESPLRIKIGDKANLAGVIEAFGTPASYYLITDPDYLSCTIRYLLDNDCEVEILIKEDTVCQITVIH